MLKNTKKVQEKKHQQKQRHAYESRNAQKLCVLPIDNESKRDMLDASIEFIKHQQQLQSKGQSAHFKQKQNNTL